LHEGIHHIFMAADTKITQGVLDAIMKPAA